MLTACHRWKTTLLGFAGVRGISWLASVLRTRELPVAEDFTPQEVAAPGTQYLELSHGPVAYVERGQGEPAVIFIHGFGGQYHTWAPIQDALASQHRTVAFDLYGFGASARPARITPQDWAGQALELMDALQISSAVFVAHSLGGRVTLMTASRAPERVRGMLLCDCDYGQARHGYFLTWAIAHTPLLAQLMGRLRGNPEHLRRLLRYGYGSAFSVSDALLHHHRQPLRVTGTAATLTALGCANPFHELADLPRAVHCPTMVLWGTEDQIIPVEWARYLMHKLPASSELVELPGIGHFPQEECPEVVLGHLQRFLARL